MRCFAGQAALHLSMNPWCIVTEITTAPKCIHELKPKQLNPSTKASHHTEPKSEPEVSTLDQSHVCLIYHTSNLIFLQEAHGQVAKSLR